MGDYLPIKESKEVGEEQQWNDSPIQLTTDMLILFVGPPSMRMYDVVALLNWNYFLFWTIVHSQCSLFREGEVGISSWAA